MKSSGIASLGCVAICLLWAPGALRAADIEALTSPSKDLLLSLNQVGRIDKIPVKEGDFVKVGQVLVEQDTSAEKASLEQLKAAAENTVRVRAAQAQLDQKRLDLKNLQYALENKAATQFEVDHAVLDVTIAELSLELADLEHRQDQLKYDEACCHVARMRLLSPVDGKVERIMIREGETADPQSKVIRVVKLDPLWMDVPVPLANCRNLQVDQKVEVMLPDMDKPQTGRIEFIAAVADPGSNTLTIRVELPNPQQRRAGEHVKIRFPASENRTEAAATSPAAASESKKE